MKLGVTVLLLLALCTFCACGGGNNEPAANSDKPEAYEPDFSNPVGASDALARAIEDQDLELIEQVLAPDEREASMETYRRNFESTKKAGGDWKLEFEQGYYIDDDHTVTRVYYIQYENGKEKARAPIWTVFKRIDDGTWRYSPKESRKYAEEVESQPEDPPGNEPAANDG